MTAAQTHVNVTVPDERPCPHCLGSGWVPREVFPGVFVKKICGGLGRVRPTLLEQTLVQRLIADR